MLDCAVRGQIHEVEISLTISDLSAFPAAEIGEERVGILDEAPKSYEEIDWSLKVCFGRILELGVCRFGENGAQKRTHADTTHGGIEIVHVDILAVAIDVAVVCESIDDGTRASAGACWCRSVISSCWAT